MQPVDSTFVINSFVLARSHKAGTEIKSCSWAPLADLQNGDKFLPGPCFPLLLGNLLRNGKYDWALSVLPCTITCSLIPAGKWGSRHCRVLGRRTAYGGVDKYLASECRIDNYPFNSVEPPQITLLPNPVSFISSGERYLTWLNHLWLVHVLAGGFISFKQYSALWVVG